MDFGQVWAGKYRLKEACVDGVVQVYDLGLVTGSVGSFTMPR